MNKTVAHVLCKTLKDLNVEYTFGMPGTQTLDLFDSLLDVQIQNILITNELFGLFIANGYSWASGKSAVCLSIAGPGFTNMFTGLAQALTDSIPLLVLVVGEKTSGKKFYIHEIEKLKAVSPIVKQVIQIQSAADVSKNMVKAYTLSQTGEPGPVVVEISESLLKERVLQESDYKEAIEENVNNFQEIQAVLDAIKNSNLCGIYVGQGVANATEELVLLAEGIQSPVATTISGKGIFPEDHPLSLGFGIGNSGTDICDSIFRRCDLILAIGCKFSEMATGDWGFEYSGKLVQVDINEKVLNKNYQADISFVTDAKHFLKTVCLSLEEIRRPTNNALLEEISQAKLAYSQRSLKRGSDGFLHPLEIFSSLRERMPRDAILTVDCGYHQIWSISGFPVYEKRSYITSADYQAMGFSLPAAIGAKLACPKKRVVSVLGDGGFLFSGFELLTAVRERLNIIFVIFNDEALGLIKVQQQQKFSRYNSIDLINPDYQLFAKALNVKYLELKEQRELKAIMDEAFSVEGPVIVNARVDYSDEPKYYKGRKKTAFSRLTIDEQKALYNKFLKQREINE